MKNYQLDLSKQIFVNFESIWNIFQWYIQYLKWFEELIWVEEVFQCVIIYAYIQICPLSQNSKPYMHFIIFTLQEVSKFLSSEHWNATWKLQLPRGNKNNQKFLQETHTPAYMNNCMIFLWKAYLSFLALEKMDEIQQMTYSNAFLWFFLYSGHDLLKFVSKDSNKN